MPANLMRRTAPDTDLVPAMDNGADSEFVSLPSALAQVRALLETGSIEQRCNGSCNPD